MSTSEKRERFLKIHASEHENIFKYCAQIRHEWKNVK
jgi:hypothetical protein